MADDSDVKQEDPVVSNSGHAEVANDASNIHKMETTSSDPAEPSAKRIKMDDSASANGSASLNQTVPGEGLHDAPAGKENMNPVEGQNGDAPKKETRTGLAPVKKEYLITVTSSANDVVDDDAAEGRTGEGDARDNRDDRDARDDRDRDDRDKKKRKGKKRAKGGQNTDRSFGHFDDAIHLCNSRAFYPEFSPRECKFGDRCKHGHDLRKYLEEGRRDDVEVFGGKCHNFEVFGKCPSGWKCRFVKSHMREIEHEDGRKELVLVDNNKGEGQEDSTKEENEVEAKGDEDRPDVFNIVSMSAKIELNRKKVDFSKADSYIQWLEKEAKVNNAFNQRRKDQSTESIEDLRAQFVDPPFRASEKRRLYFGPETPTLAPLTTQGNLPFRRLCVELGAQFTYSEMALGQPLVQGMKADWTLMKAHKSEIEPPKITPGKNVIFDDYDNSRDLRFGAQISSNQPWIAVKAAESLTRLCPHLRLIDLNCGCPIDMVYKSGGGSALLESHGKLERMIRGMNAMSGEVPITAKIRTGVKNNRPTAQAVVGKLAFGAREHRERLGAPGCAAVTLHGRSREMRYTKRADWGFIADCAALIKTYNSQKDALTDTAAEPDESTLPNAKDGRMYFLGNGDCFSHEEYYENIEKSKVDSIMIGRGALIKPWLFEEIEKGQYLDKSPSERLQYIEKFVRYGLEAWGSDELGIGFTRRFLLEWLSFSHRYVPIGLLEHLPPSMNDRPPAYHGRNDMETLMASNNYMDWVKITEMFLGPVHPGFKFQPKHKSNAYEAEG